MVPSVIQGSSKILGPVEKSSPAAEIMDVPVQRPDYVSQLRQKLFCMVGKASRPRLRNIGWRLVKLLMIRRWFMVWRFWFMIWRFAVVRRFLVV